MRYTIQKENEVKELAADGYNLEYIAAKTSLPKKVIWGWCPELRPQDDIIKQSVKQRYHFIFPDFEAKITTAFSPFVTEEITDDEWEELNNVVYNTMFDLAVYVFRNAITELPEFSDVSKLCEEPFLQYCRRFWDYDSSEYIKEVNKEQEVISPGYAESCYNAIHSWGFLKDKKVKDITKGDLQIMQERLVEKDLSPSRIYFILRAGIVPLRYAYEKGITLTNVNDFKMPKKRKKETNIIPDSLAALLFSEKWENEQAYFANVIAYYGKLTLKEVKGLNNQDIDDNDVFHSRYILIDDKRIENPHPKEFSLPKRFRDEFYFYLNKRYAGSFEDWINKVEDDSFWDEGNTRNTWNDELKKQASRYTSREVNFSMWSN